MDIKKKIVVFCALLIVFSTFTVYTVPPSPPPSPWRLELGDGLTFYMVSRLWHNSAQRAEFQAFEGRRSGLYRGDELIYEVEGDFFFRRDEIFISGDGLTILGFNLLFTDKLARRVSHRAHFFYQGQAVRTFYPVYRWGYSFTADTLHTLQMTVGDWNGLAAREIVIDLSDISIISEQFTDAQLPIRDIILLSAVLIFVGVMAFVLIRRVPKGTK